MRDFQVKRIGAKLNLIVPSDLAMIPDVHILKKLVVIPNPKDAFSDESREVDFAFRAVIEFDVNAVIRSRFNSNRSDKFVHKNSISLTFDLVKALPK